MGQCGRFQDAATTKPKDNHGLCPHFYNSAFTHNFYATKNSYGCVEGDKAEYPQNYKMGYNEDRKSSVRGVLFCPTTFSYPYTSNTRNLTEIQTATDDGINIELKGQN